MKDQLKAYWGDHLLWDPITKWKVYAAEVRRLPKFSGGEGLYTTAYDSMRPHMGFAPYPVYLEVPVQFTYNGGTNDTFGAPPWSGTTDPATTTVKVNGVLGFTGTVGSVPPDQTS